MTRTRMVVIAGSGMAAILAWLLVTSVSYSRSIAGRVIDEKTGASVVGAVVVASWQRIRSVNAAPMGYAEVQETVTDSHGVFRLKPWGPRVHIVGSIAPGQPVILVYQDGYQPLVLHDPAETGLTLSLRRADESSEVAALRNFAWEFSAAFFQPQSRCPWYSVRAMWRALKHREIQLAASGAVGILPPPFSVAPPVDCKQDGET